jgi:DNA-binding transcriptional regulator LsrR (DeoR family)
MKEVRRRYEAGATVREVADGLGVSVTPVRRALQQAGAKIRKRGRRSGPVDPARVKTFQGLRNRGWTFNEIAEEYGLSRQAVQQYLAQHVQ